MSVVVTATTMDGHPAISIQVDGCCRDYRAGIGTPLLQLCELYDFYMANNPYGRKNQYKDMNKVVDVINELHGTHIAHY